MVLWVNFRKIMIYYNNLPISAQTIYAEIYDKLISNDFNDLSGSFHKKNIKDKSYWYFNFRDIYGEHNTVYVGPDNDNIKKLVSKYELGICEKQSIEKLVKSYKGFQPVQLNYQHFSVIKKLAEYGFFKAGGLMIGSYAFIAIASMLGVTWNINQYTEDVDFAHTDNPSIALPNNLKLDTHAALESLNIGLLPMTNLDRKPNGQYRAKDLRVDFVTSKTRTGLPVTVNRLNLTLAPLPYMEFSLENPVQALLLSHSEACLINLPDPARFVIHKMIVASIRPISQQNKISKDFLQCISLIEWYIKNNRFSDIQEAWLDAYNRGPSWKKPLVKSTQLITNEYKDIFNGLSFEINSSPSFNF